MQEGQILKIHSDFYYIQSGDDIIECKLRSILKKQKQKIYVGDYVKFKDGAIIEILPRHNFITRPTVANLDQIVIVSAIKEPELDYTQLNRYIALAKYHNLKTVLCFNKNDLSNDDSIIEKVFNIYEPLGFDILFTSALEGLGLEEFKDILSGKTSALAGNSGVGKSSLINSICNINLKTKRVSEKTGRGIHTTRHCEIISINKNTRIVDTPGFSNLKFDFLLPEEIDSLFVEMLPFKGYCKFQNCLHINETDCAIKSHIGEIDITRYESYLTFVEEAKEYKEKIKYRGIKVETTQKKTHDKISVKISTKKRQVARNTQKQNIYKDLTDGDIN
ncbi:ribosome small subunit-dependent GTPase A [bacterium]|nr:ribosome small subunit-dependent GTPase A [bacterium]